MTSRAFMSIAPRSAPLGITSYAASNTTRTARLAAPTLSRSEFLFDRTLSYGKGPKCKPHSCLSGTTLSLPRNCRRRTRIC